jgi:hypothetical protein
MQISGPPVVASVGLIAASISESGLALVVSS